MRFIKRLLHRTSTAFCAPPPLCRGTQGRENKDVRHKGKGNQKGNGPQKAKVINKVRCYGKDREIKSMLVYEDWMNVPITFTPVAAKDLLEEPYYMGS
ncbi:hypothetical protein Tco_0261988 [Tanacetum coccineum]